MSALTTWVRDRRRAVVVAGGLTAVVLLSAVAVAQPEFEVPGFLPADQQIPVAPPTEGQQVAVLQVALAADGDTVVAEVKSTLVIDNYAPKSVARSAGEWEVRVLGERELTYRVPNPFLDVEIEDPENQKAPYHAVPTDALDWTLIVPLYDQGQPLGATRIEVTDVDTKAVILATDLP
jgi:hypothetical protein